ncbi:ataxin-3-like isoform X1 [Schistocerca cancellata]|uniref:ataxin-3-like isoform X1 n=1 Tax=Schistocerca cancellata TaxID=274614 RepID=UPI0021186A4C|nr:ataxin-3-like isoform X1 [Schistocerca cancellata]
MSTLELKNTGKYFTRHQSHWVVLIRHRCKNMEAIFHEKQEGSLCAQHCLNALLQGPYFTAVDLATIAQRMDYEERLRMSESGVDSEEYRRFLEQPSGNYDDSGYFSVQVISSALEVWGLELVPYNSTDERALEAQRCPGEMNAFICNYRDHWFTIRRLGQQWFNLNSLLSGPELISDTYLAMFLAQLQQEGYSIFVVFGDLPESEADNLLHLAPAVQHEKPRLLATIVRKVVPVSAQDSEEDQDLQRAVRLSLTDNNPPRVTHIPIEIERSQSTDDTELQAALRLSLQDESSSRVTPANEEEGDAQFHRALQLSLTTDTADGAPPIPRTISQDEELQLQKALSLSLQTKINDTEGDDEHELQRALQMSLECCDSNECQAADGMVDPEELRRRRLAYLESVENQSSNYTNHAPNQNQLNT